MIALAALLAVLGAFGLGFTLGSRRERASARADVAMWRELATELHTENGKLRCNAASFPGGGGAASGEPNALHRLRKRLGFGRGEVAQALGIIVADVETLERTRLRLLDVDAVERFVGALGCRLDVVAVHVDGEAIWLSSDSSKPTYGEHPPECPECAFPMARYAGADGQGWICVRCEGSEP